MITFVFDDDEFVKMYKFRTQDNHIILIEEFSEGIATIRPTEEYRNLEEFADVISGCLDKRSNFVSKLMEVYACKEDEEYERLRTSNRILSGAYADMVCISSGNRLSSQQSGRHLSGGSKTGYRNDRRRFPE